MRNLLLIATVLYVTCGFSRTSEAVEFVRGDATNDGVIDISDGVRVLAFLFGGGPEPTCADTADSNDSGEVDLSDAIYVFSFLFLGGTSIPTPYPECGEDPTDDALACTSYGHCDTPPSTATNVLLIIADDLGVDSTVCYAANAPPMPNIESLCNTGVRFTNVWSAPVCSPTRATILTGRYGFRTGIGSPVAGRGAVGIGLDEFTLPMALDAHPELDYEQACLGKWHLSSNSNGGSDNPNLMGFAHFSGVLGGIPDYFQWTKTVNGTTSRVENYGTTENVDDALSWIDAREEAPWVLWLAFNAPHAPFHLPPAELHSQSQLSGDEADINRNTTAYFRAAVEAMDTEIGRLLASLDPDVRARTVVMFVGDNGTPARTAPPGIPRNRAKDSLYQGGVHVPLVVAGAGVVDGGRTVDALVNTTDLFASILELVGTDLASTVPAGVVVDSTSFVSHLRDPEAAPEREWIFAELFGESLRFPERAGKTVRDERYKLIRFDDGTDELYDMDNDPGETDDLLADLPLSVDAEAHRDSLLATLRALVEGPGSDLPAAYRSFTSNVEAVVEGETVVVRSDGVPNHPSPYFPSDDPRYEPPHEGMEVNRSRIGEQSLVFRMPAEPRVAAEPTDTALGPIGLSVTGVALFNQYALEFAPVENEFSTFDLYNGHPTRRDLYHYHIEPVFITSTSRSTLVGILLDGFPVYGPEEVDGSAPADLDECNGHIHATPEYPEGIYHYHITAVPPYICGCYRGTPGSSTN